MASVNTAIRLSSVCRINSCGCFISSIESGDRPQIKRLATTIRVQRNVDHHELAAVLVSRHGAVVTGAHAVTPIVDRIGAGDAFAAGVLHGLRTGMSDADSVHFGLAATCLKHSVPGDFNLVGAGDVAAFLGEHRFDVKR